jgi:hypothetical protein
MFHKTCTDRSSLLASSILLQRSLAKEEEEEEEEKKASKNSFNTCQSKLYSINLHEPWSDPCSSPGSVDNYTARMSCERKKEKQAERKKASKQALEIASTTLD